MKQLIHVALFFIAITISHARVGETLEQCRTRYGDTISKDDKEGTATFRKSGLIVLVYYKDAKADCVVFRKIQTDPLGNGEEISENEIEGLLRANGGERKWNKSKSPSIDSEWVTADGELHAHYANFKHVLGVATKGWLERKSAAKKDEENQVIKGF